MALLFIILFVIGTVGMYLFERGVNDNFINLGQSFWSSLVYLLSGFEDREPVTIEGRVFSIFIFIGSICIIGSVAGNFASIFMKLVPSVIFHACRLYGALMIWAFIRILLRHPKS